MPQTFTFASAGQTIIGRGAVRQLHLIATRLQMKRAFLVTDTTLAKVGLVEHVVGPLTEAGVTVEIFDGGEPEPSLGMVERCAVAGREFGPDAVVGLGGGSNIDAAKLTAVVVTHGGVPRDYTGEDRVPGPLLPLICVPTTAGTGSEVSHAAVFTDTENHVKVSTLSEYVRPTFAVVDPDLTRTCPAKVTADSGIDALVHAIEAYTNIHHFELPESASRAYTGKSAIGDLFAGEAIRLIGAHLRTAVNDGSHMEAREGMARAAMLAGLAFSNAGVGIVHALEYPLGGAVHVAHGAGNGLLLPHVMRFNLPVRRQEFTDIAHWLGVSTPSPEAGIEAVEHLCRDVGIPQRMSELGVTEEMLPTFADKAFALKRLMNLNPRPVERDDLLNILKAAL